MGRPHGQANAHAVGHSNGVREARDGKLISEYSHKALGPSEQR